MKTGARSVDVAQDRLSAIGNRKYKLFCIALCAVLIGFCFSAEAQHAKVPRIGYLLPGAVPSSSALSNPNVEAFRDALRELGYVEGKNVAIEYRWGEGNRDQLFDLAVELVDLKAHVIVARNTPATRGLPQSWIPSSLKSAPTHW